MRSVSMCRFLYATALASPVMPALAQTSPFATGTAAFQSNFLTILTPVAVIAVMALGVGAWFNRISWGWAGYHHRYSICWRDTSSDGARCALCSTAGECVCHPRSISG
jgi:hypothetical protein